MLNSASSSAVRPAISIVCPSYNHGRFVGAFIDSLVAQTDGSFEVIIIDDASTDDNLSVIRSCHDPRIRVVARDVNRGFCASLNEGIRLARAEVVAFIASDDLASPRYVERVLAAFAASPSAIAAYVELDRMGPGEDSLGEPCLLPATADRLGLLRNSFLGHNQLPSPGMAVRREVALGLLLPEGTVQYSDWIFQNRILLMGDIVLIREQLVRYRVSPSSLSARTLGRIARDQLETRIMMDDFLAIKEMPFLAQVFPEEIKAYAALPDRHLPYVLGRIALLSEIPEKRCWGYETIMRHLSEPGVAESLQSLCCFTHKDLMALTPTDNALLAEEARRRRRRNRRLLRAALAIGLLGLLAALWSAQR
jgi:glycosyltransferase involved in cell wall biosynthesis